MKVAGAETIASIKLPLASSVIDVDYQLIDKSRVTSSNLLDFTRPEFKLVQIHAKIKHRAFERI